MARTLVTQDGTPIALGRTLGRGGEGAVFELPARPHLVAKVYHQPPDPDKQAKLAFMAANASPELLNYVAWPSATLHAARGGPVLGFLMPKVSGKLPVHMVYGPAARREHLPKAAWDFLLFVARNIAASFQVLHEAGHVIGDVNQDSVMVGADSKVHLIDADSYQINANASLHYCEVGVSIFTPPEMQSLKSFDGFTRTTNHDNFGLALLLFHVLFGGRHPYSGVPLKAGVGEALEADICAFRYAYARDAQLRGIAPPPRSIPVTMLPAPAQAMFHHAFTEAGTQGQRPSAAQWVATLDAIRADLKRCEVSAAHIYPSHSQTGQTQCPWCALEGQGVVYFIDPSANLMSANTGFVRAKVWVAIQAIAPPPDVAWPTPSRYAVVGAALPGSIPNAGTLIFIRICITVAALAVSVVAPSLTIVWLALGVAAWMVAPTIGQTERLQERERRRVTLQAAQLSHDQLLKGAQQAAGPQGFATQRAELVKLHEEYQALPKLERQELERLQANARERQKQAFLATCSIAPATIFGIGPQRKAVLRSFGIETAADLTRARLSQIHGFGDHLVLKLMDWKTECERRFVFNPAQDRHVVTDADRHAVRVKLTARRIAIERALLRGTQDLQELARQAPRKAAQLRPALERSAQALAQAQADFDAA